MPKGYMFYDDETANHMERICAIGYVLADMDGNKIGEPVSQLINPESDFDYWNTRVNHISAVDVEEMPTLKSFCEERGFIGLLEDYIFVAHNAQNADLRHIKKSLKAYEIDMPEVSFVDTMMLSIEDAGIGGLVDACEHYGVVLDEHHDALADAVACMGVFEAATKNLGAPEPILWVPGERTASAGSRNKRRTFSEGSLGVVNASDETIEHLLERFANAGLRGNPDEIETLEGLKLVVTGKVPNYENDKIELALKTIGAKPAKSVSGKTQLLVVGHNAGQGKINPALENGIPVITVPELLDIMSR